MAIIKTNLTHGTTGNLPAVNGSAVTALNASNVASGTLATARYVQGGITMADAWRITANYEKGSSGGSYLTSNWERIDTDGFGQICTGLSNSSGEFTFPSTGVYFIHFQAYCDGQNGASTYAGIRIDTTTDNSSYTQASSAYDSIQATNLHMAGSTTFIFDVTNTTTHKVKFYVEGQTNTVFNGNSATTNTGFYALRLGDT